MVRYRKYGSIYDPYLESTWKQQFFDHIHVVIQLEVFLANSVNNRQVMIIAINDGGVEGDRGTCGTLISNGLARYFQASKWNIIRKLSSKVIIYIR